MIKKILIGIFSILLFSCTIKPNIHLKKVEIKNFENKITDNITFTKNWWEYFNDKTLNNLINNGLKNNIDIKIAVKKIKELDNLLKERKSLLYPDISIQINRSKSKQHLHNLPYFIPSTIETKLFHGEVLSSYEVDFWGKYKNLAENAKHLLLIQKYSLEIIRKTIATNIAILYFKIINLNKQIKIYKSILRTLNYKKKILENRYERGLIPVTELYKINTQIKEFENQCVIIKSSIKATEYMLKYIINQRNYSISIFNFIDKLPVIDNLKIPANLPSDVLLRRPDVKIVVEKVLAQANIAASAKANIFPSFQLTGKYGFENKSIRELIRNSSSLYSYITNIFFTIFDFGKKKAIERKELEKLDELKLKYYQKVQEVLKNVDTALVNFKYLKQQHQNLISELKNLNKIYNLNKKNFEKGIVDIFNVINSKLDILSLKLKIYRNNFSIIEQYIKTLKELGY